MAGFGMLGEIKRENAAAEELASRRGPTACPIDGAPLVTGKNGVRDCPLGNFRWGA